MLSDFWQCKGSYSLANSSIFYPSDTTVVDVGKCCCKFTKMLHWCAGLYRGTYSSFRNVLYLCHSEYPMWF